MDRHWRRRGFAVGFGSRYFFVVRSKTKNQYGEVICVFATDEGAMIR